MADGFLIEVPHNQRNGRGRYWRPNRSGYALSAVTAGVYTKEEADQICRGVDYDLKAVPDPLGREPGEVIDFGPSWNDDPMLYAYQAGRGRAPGGTLLRLTGEFTPQGERGPSTPEEIVDHINDNFVNYWSGCEGLRLETVGMERRSARWKCTACSWVGPVPRRDCGYLCCPLCNDDVEEL